MAHYLGALDRVDDILCDILTRYSSVIRGPPLDYYGCTFNANVVSCLYESNKMGRGSMACDVLLSIRDSDNLCSVLHCS